MTATEGEGLQENTISLTPASLKVNYVTHDSLQTTEDEKLFSNNLLTAGEKVSPENKEPGSNTTTSEKTPDNERKEGNPTSTLFPTTLLKPALNLTHLTNATLETSIQISETTWSSTTILTRTSSTITAPATTEITTTAILTTTSIKNSTTTTTTTMVIREFLVTNGSKMIKKLIYAKIRHQNALLAAQLKHLWT
jgi:hypothetical protein